MRALLRVAVLMPLLAIGMAGCSDKGADLAACNAENSKRLPLPDPCLVSGNCPYGGLPLSSEAMLEDDRWRTIWRLNDQRDFLKMCMRAKGWKWGTDCPIGGAISGNTAGILDRTRMEFVNASLPKCYVRVPITDRLQ